MSDFQTIKYRLIGAAVIVISFIFAWWLLLDHEVHRLSEEQMDIPETMQIERFNIEKPKAPDLEKQTINSETRPATKKKPDEEELPEEVATSKPKQPEPKQPSPSKPAKKMSALDSQGLPEAWILQVASFEEKNNALKLQKTLAAKDLPAYVKTFNLPEGKRYRVLIGPKLSKERASKLSRLIQKEHGLISKIMQYKPGFEE